MKNKSVRALFISLTAALLLTGCSSFPEMTDEQYDQTVQYAVSLLMKYSNNGVERLSSISALELQKQIEKEEREKRKAERDALNQEAVENAELNPETDGSEETEDVAKLDETDTEKPQTTDESKTDSQSEEKSDDQVKVDVSSDGEDEDDISKLLDEYEDELKQGEVAASDPEKTDDEEKTEDSETAKEETKAEDNKKADESEDGDNTSEDKEEPLQEDSSQEELAQSTDKTVDGMRQELSKGIFLTYSGYSVAGSYPDDDDVFVINAEAGRKLLILNFRISNTSGSDMSVDMEKGNPHFQVVLNGKNVGYTNVTWLDNDLSTFKGTIKAGDKVSMVLVKQMDAAKVKSIDSLGLIGDLGGETIQFNLE